MTPEPEKIIFPLIILLPEPITPNPERGTQNP